MAEKFHMKLIHAGYSSDSNQHSVAVPVYATASYEIVTPERGDRLRSGAELGDLYSRLSNPTNSVLEARVASLDGGVGAVAVASGMAAISGTIIAVTGGSGRNTGGIPILRYHCHKDPEIPPQQPEIRPGAVWHNHAEDNLSIRHLPTF